MTTSETGHSKRMGSGCIFGFFNFSHLLTGKRFYQKRLPPPPPPLPSPDVPANSTTELVRSSDTKEQIEKPQLHQPLEPELRSPGSSTVEAAKLTVSPWKFVREAPRLSLDSRLRHRSNAAGDGNEERENQRRSPCVIARLMGLEQTESSSESPEKKVELRRSASESRSRDHRFLHNPTFLSPPEERKSDQCEVSRASNIKLELKKSNPNPNQNPINQRRLTSERKKSSYYNTADFFPPKQQQQQQQGVTIYGEIERRLRSNNSKDLETLKNILEALQLKGLLHSSTATPTPPLSRRHRESSISTFTPALMSPRRDRPARNARRNVNRSSSPPLRRKGGPLSVETQKRSDSPVQSPKMVRSDRMVNRLPRGRKSTVERNRGERCDRRGLVDDEASSAISESSYSTSAHSENEKWGGGEETGNGRGGSLLERCDKLLHSIAEMNLNPNSAELQQPSPVSVLDSSFYKEEEESSPSPVKQRSIDFKDQVVSELEDELWSPPSVSSSSSSSSSSSRTLLTSYPDHHGIDSSSLDDPDFIYISKVFRSSNYLPDEPDLFLLLEKQESIRGNKEEEEENSKVSFLHRKIIFDTVTEMLNQTRNLPPPKSGPGRLSLGQIWAEHRRIRELGPAQDLFEVIIGVLKKDLAQDSVAGWKDCPVEISEAVLDVERLIFKDLIGESIGDMAAIATKSMGAQKYCRKLVF